MKLLKKFRTVVTNYLTEYYQLIVPK